MDLRSIQRRVIGDEAESLVLAELESRAENVDIQIFLSRVAPFDKREESRYIGYDHYMKYSVQNISAYIVKEFLIEVKSSYPEMLKKTTDFRISEAQLNKYREISDINKIPFLYFFVDFRKQLIYRITDSVYYRNSTIDGKYYSYTLRNSDIYCDINDVVIDDLDLELERRLYNHKDSILNQ